MNCSGTAKNSFLHFCIDSGMTYKMRKLLVTASVYSHIYRFHQPYLRAFREEGWETHVACAGLCAGALYIDRPIEIPFEKKMWSASNLRALRMLRELIRAEDYDLIITHTSLAAFLTRLAVKGNKARPPLINVMHGYLFDAQTNPLKRTALLNAERLTAAETDLLLTMNEWDYHLAKREKLGKRIERIPGMGLDTSLLDAAKADDGAELRRRLGIDKTAFVLIFAAEFSKRKSQSTLLQALNRLPENVVLLLPGDGNLRESCRAEAERLGLSGRVVMPGIVEDIAPWYRAANAAVSSSRSEGLPFNVLEAMYMGLPIVASAVKGNTDLIRDGETGLLFPYGDAEACAACILRLLSDDALRQEMGERTKSEVQRYMLHTVFSEVMEWYLSAVPLSSGQAAGGGFDA